MSIRDAAVAVATNTKVATAVAATTTTTSGLGLFLNVIPDDINKLATLIGVVLSLVLIVTHARKGHIEYKKTKLELKLMREADERRAAEAAEMRRRESD